MFINYKPNMHKSNFLFILLFLGSVHITFAQLSTKHFIPPLTSAEFGNANPENQYFYISTPSTQEVSFVIKPLGQPDSSNITGIVSNTNSQEIFIGSGNNHDFYNS